MPVVLAIIGFLLLFAGFEFILNGPRDWDDEITVAVGAVIIGAICMGCAALMLLPW